MVIPVVAPTKIPFFHPNTSTIKILNMVFNSNPKIANSRKLVAQIAIKILAPITSSIANAFLCPNSLITINEFANIL